MKDIFELVEKGSLEEIKELIEADKTLAKVKDFKKRNLIMLASKRGDAEIFNYLLTKKAPFKGSDDKKNTALHYAVEGNNLEIVKTLIDKGLKLEQENKSKEKAIDFINRKTSLEVFNLLINSMSVDEKDYFYEVLRLGNLEIAKYLHSKYGIIKISEEQFINIIKKNNNLEIVKFLVKELGFDVSKNIIIDSFDKLNALQHYIDEYYIKDDEKLAIVKFLIDNGADVNYLDDDDRDAMYYALKNHNIEIAELLLKAKSSTKKLAKYLTNFGNFHYRDLRENITIKAIRFIIDNVKNIDLEVVKKKLLEEMADKDRVLDNILNYASVEDAKYFMDIFNLNIEEEYFKVWSRKYSLFTRFIVLNKLEIVKELVKMGADVNREDVNGNTPIYYASFARSESAVELLKFLHNSGADLTVLNADGRNLLFEALISESFYSSKFFFEQGLKLNMTLNEYLTHSTYSSGNLRVPPFSIIKLMLDNNIWWDTKDTGLVSSILTAILSEKEDENRFGNFIYLIKEYDIDLNSFSNDTLNYIFDLIINNDSLSSEENFNNFKVFMNYFKLNSINEELKNKLIAKATGNIEIFKIIEKEFNIEISDKTLLEKYINFSIENMSPKVLEYLLLKDENFIVQDFSDYKKDLTRRKRENNSNSYYSGYEKRAIAIDEMIEIIKKHEKNVKKAIKNGKVTENKEPELTEEEKIIQKLDAPWIKVNDLPKLYFKKSGELSNETTLMLLSTIKNIGISYIKEQLDGITDESLLELFKYLKKEAPVKEMWIYDLLIFLAEKDNSLFALLEEYIESYGYSGGYHLQNQLINKLTEINNIEGIKFIYKLTKSKRNSIKNSANNAFENKSYMLDVSIEELKDMLISDFGLNSNKELDLDYGARTITVKLMPDFKLTYIDKAINKTYKTLPKATKSDDINKVDEATKFVKKMKKEIKKIVTDMKTRLKAQLINPKYSKFSYWEQLFIKNPILNVFATNIFWGVYSKDEKLEKVFIYTEDGTYLDLAQDELSLNENDLISIVHPVELTADQLEDAGFFIDDYELTQPINQINRQIFEAKDKNAKAITDFNKKVVKTNTFHYALTNAGFSRGMVEDNGTIFTYRMDVKDIEVLVTMSGIVLGYYDNGDLEIGDVIFRKNGDDLELGKVNKRVFSEVYLSLQLL